MIAAAPYAAAGNMAGVFDKVKAFVETSRSAAADGLTWAEFGELLVALVRLLVEALDTVSVLTGPQKKAMVLEAVGLLFDAVADKAIPAALYPLWLLARPAIRQLVIAIAAGAVEQIIPLVRA